MTLWRWGAATAVALLASSAGYMDARGQAEPPATSPCHVTGEIIVWPKLACPYDVVEIEARLQLSCPADQALGVRWLRLRHPLPSALRLVNEGGDAGAEDGVLDRTFLAPPDQLTVKYPAQVTGPGTFRLTGARVTVEDEAGGQATVTLEPATLMVSAICGRNRSLFLPMLYRPSCVPQAEPADVALLVDRSSSVGDAGLAVATEHVRGFLNALDLSRDRIALIAFDQHALVKAPLGSSQEDIERAVATLDAAPGTRLERAIQTGALELTGPRSRPGRRRIMVLITDGVQVGPGDDSVVLATAAAARAEGIAILSLALGPRPNRDLLEAIGGSPGRTVPATTAGELAGAWRTLATVAGCAK